MINLKPCPFCGEEQPKKVRGDGNVPYESGMSRSCYFCGAAVTHNWNTRPIEDALNNRIAELEAENDMLQKYNDGAIDEIDALQARIANIEQANRGWCEQYSHELYENIKSAYRLAELSQALGLITTLKPTMVMDTDHPLDMAKEVEVYVSARIAELEAENERFTAHSDIERQDDKWIPEVQDV